MGIKPIKLFLFTMLSLLLQSCILFTFVGGHGVLKGYKTEGNYQQVSQAVDHYVKNNKETIIREYDGSGYDKGSGRNYKLINKHLFFTIRFYGDTLDPNYKAEIGIKFIRFKGKAFNPEQKLTKAEDQIFDEALLIIEEAFINPIQQQFQ